MSAAMFGLGRMNQQTKGNNSARQTRDTTTKTWITYGNSTWHAGKYKIYKFHRRYILEKGCLEWHICLHFRHTWLIEFSDVVLLFHIFLTLDYFTEVFLLTREGSPNPSFWTIRYSVPWARKVMNTSNASVCCEKAGLSSLAWRQQRQLTNTLSLSLISRHVSSPSSTQPGSLEARLALSVCICWGTERDGWVFY